MKLPIPHKNALEDSKIFAMVERWSKVKNIPKVEMEVDDSSASETPSRCATPVSVPMASHNTPSDLTKLTDNSESDGDMDRMKSDSACTSPKGDDKSCLVEERMDPKIQVDSSTPNAQSDCQLQTDVESTVNADSLCATQSEIVSQSCESDKIKDETVLTKDESELPIESTMAALTSATQPESVLAVSTANPDSKPPIDISNTLETEDVSQTACEPVKAAESPNTSTEHPIKPNSLEEGELVADTCKPDLKTYDLEKATGVAKPDLGSDLDVAEVDVKSDKASGIAVMAGKLLETWSSLKVCYFDYFYAKFQELSIQFITRFVGGRCVKKIRNLGASYISCQH